MILWLCLNHPVFSLVGEAHSLEVERILYKEKSEYQEILVFEVQHFRCMIS